MAALREAKEVKRRRGSREERREGEAELLELGW